jgi:hypothetical protein
VPQEKDVEVLFKAHRCSTLARVIGVTKTSNVLNEVWKWKKQIYEERKGMTLTE